MCGRYTLTSPEDIAARFGLGALSETGSDIRPRFNVSPSQSVPVIRSHDGQTGLELMRWGFQPAWMEGKGQPPTADQRQERDAVGAADVQVGRRQEPVSDPGRRLLRVEGHPGPEDQAADAHPAEGRRAVRLRGIWTWNGEEPTCAIITTAPNELVSTIHDRMPVILTEHGERLWIDQGAPPDEAMSVLAPYPADLMEAFAVSTAVNHAGRDAAEVMAPVEG